MNRDKFLNLGIYISLFFTALFVLLQSPLAPFANGVPGVDSSVFIYSAKSIISGKLMYKEIFDHKGPVIYLIDMLGLGISGNKSFLGIWLLELISLFVSSIFLYKTIRFLYNRLISLLSAISTLLFMTPLLIGGNLTEEWAILLISSAIYIFTNYFLVDKKFKLHQLFLLSVTFSLTFLLKSNMIIVWVVYGVVVIFDLVKDKRISDLTAYALKITIFVVISFLPFILYGLYHGILTDAYTCFYKYNTSIYISWTGSILLVGINLVLGHGQISTIITVYMLFLIVNLVSKRLASEKTTNTLFEIGIIFSLLFSILSCAIGYCFEHYFLMLIPLFIFPCAFWIDLIYRHLNTKYNVFLLIAFFVFNANFMICHLKSIKANYDKNEISGLSVPSRNTMDSIKTVIDKNVSQNEKIFIKGNLCSLYLLSDKYCDSKYPYRTLFTSEMKEDYLSNILRAKPKLIITGSAINDDTAENDDLNTRILAGYTKMNTKINGVQFWLIKQK